VRPKPLQSRRGSRSSEKISRATIAVLVSARAHARPIAAALGAAGVSCIGVKIVPLAELSVIRDLVALTRALHHLADRAAWLVVLRAPWCGATLATLAALSERNDALLLWEALADEARLARCEPQERARLARVRAVLQDALATRAKSPLAEWLERTWVQLGGCDAYSLTDVKHARAFFTAIAERTASGNWRGPDDLEILMQQLFAASDAADNPVQIMTIHHAKGLQFHHVFVPCLERDMNPGPEPLMRWLDLPKGGGGSDLLVAPVPRTGARQGGILGRYIKQLMKVRAAHEQLRLLYVATTRARHTLHLSAAPPRRADGTAAPRAGTLLARLWPALDAEELPTAACWLPRKTCSTRCCACKDCARRGSPRYCRAPRGRACPSRSHWNRSSSAGWGRRRVMLERWCTRRCRTMRNAQAPKSRRDWRAAGALPA
jgi:ATP-dependent helicase/nuclease subunit A